MISPAIIKILRDIRVNRGKSLLVIASLTLGILASGISLYIGDVLISDLDTQYRARYPHDFLLKTVDGIPAGTIEALAQDRDDIVLEARHASLQRIVSESGTKSNANVFAINDFTNMKVDTLTGEDGSAIQSSPGYGRCFFERSTKGAVRLKTRDKVLFERIDGRLVELEFGGYIHDLTTEPYQLDGDLSAYCSVETLALLQDNAGPNEIRGFVFGGNQASVNAAVRDLEDKLETAGIYVDQTTIPKRGQHPLSPIIMAVITVLAIIGLCSALAAGALIANTVTTLIVQQRRQIGIMKALGANRARIFGMYLLYVATLGAISLVIALAVTAGIGRLVAGSLAFLLNFDLLAFRFPFSVVIVELATAILIPAISSAIPLNDGVSVTVREAMSNRRASTGSWGKNRFRRPWPLHIPSLFISIRNLSRARGKVALSLLVLAFGGSLFISIGNLNTAFDSMLVSGLRYFQSDVVLTLGRSVDADAMRHAAEKVTGVVHAESWPFTPAQILVPGSDTTCKILLMAPPSGTTIINPSIVKGRMIGENDRNAIFINNHLTQRYPDLEVGSRVMIRARRSLVPFTVIGIGNTMGQPPHPSVFADPETLSALLDGTGMANNCYLVTERHDDAAQRQYALAVEAEIERELKSPVIEINTGAALVEQYAEPMQIVGALLSFVVALAVLIGGVGLGGVLGINVLERKRELGIYRTIGAGNASILAMIIFEGAMIALLSLPGSIILSIPTTLILNRFVGKAMFTLPLPFEYDARIVCVWGILIVAVGTASGILPAIRAARSRIRVLLALE